MLVALEEVKLREGGNKEDEMETKTHTLSRVIFFIGSSQGDGESWGVQPDPKCWAPEPHNEER